MGWWRGLKSICFSYVYQSKDYGWRSNDGFTWIKRCPYIGRFLEFSSNIFMDQQLDEGSISSMIHLVRRTKNCSIFEGISLDIELVFRKIQVYMYWLLNIYSDLITNQSFWFGTLILYIKYIILFGFIIKIK